VVIEGPGVIPGPSSFHRLRHYQESPVLIESLIKPTQPNRETGRKTRTVTVYGVAYEFAELAKSRYVAEVTEDKAIECMLGHPKQFREYVAAGAARAAGTPALSKDAPKADAPKAVEKKAEKPVAPPASDEDDEKDRSQTADTVTREAQALLSSTPQAIKKMVEKNRPAKPVLERAIAIERAAPKTRAHVLACLGGALKTYEGEE
jgi:hypothetical protein